MVPLAPRISPRLVAEVERLADGRHSIAEICRRVGSAADRLGLARPSYERIRVLVHAHRRRRAGPDTVDVLVDVMSRGRPPQALLDHIAGVGVPKR